MVTFLALAAAVLAGTGDFFGGKATKKTNVVSVMAISHFLGLIIILILAPLMADEFTSKDFFLGVLASSFGLCGLTLLYRGLAKGPMAIVAPITAVACATLPVIWGLLSGEKLSELQIVGVFVGLLAIFLVSWTPGERKAIKGSLVLEALVAGLSFGAFFIVIDGTSETTAPWPVVGSRVFSVLVIFLFVIIGRKNIKPEKNSTPFIVGAGFFDTLANVVLLAALNKGLLSLVSVLASFYPAVTVLLARFFLKEMMLKNQIIGLAFGLTSIALLATS
ncbi:MAG TPA: DMT family transporter [Acidimicrobiales bacterium]|nr:DMT family transporter [Acidimicrobiales bacterium]